MQQNMVKHNHKLVKIEFLQNCCKKTSSEMFCPQIFRTNCTILPEKWPWRRRRRMSKGPNPWRPIMSRTFRTTPRRTSITTEMEGYEMPTGFLKLGDPRTGWPSRRRIPREPRLLRADRKASYFRRMGSLRSKKLGCTIFMHRYGKYGDNLTIG